MTIPTEPIGSIPRPPALIEALTTTRWLGPRARTALRRRAVRDTIAQFEATGSPVITDGEQRKYHNFWTYCVHGLPQHRARRLPDPVRGRPHAPHAAPHRRPVPLPALRRPLSRRGAAATRSVPVKQAVISPSALSLMYPPEGIPGYSRDQFIDDLLASTRAKSGAASTRARTSVQIDFTEGRLAVKLDPSGEAAARASST